MKDAGKNVKGGEMKVNDTEKKVKVARKNNWLKRRLFYGIKKFRKSFGERAGGYTYVETVAVIAIGAVLTAGSLLSATKLISSARRTAAKTQISQFSSALQTYFLDCGRFPTSEQGLEALWEKPVLYPVPENWNGPYLDRKPCNDPWGSSYKYLSSESSIMPSEVPEKLPFVLISYGSDCKEGGEGDASDICSWK